MLNATASHDGRTPLHVACLEGQLSVIRHLLANGASPHVTDNHGQTPLQGAIRSANVEAILLLREFGAHLGPTTMDTASEMCALAAQDNVDVLRSWYLAGANFNIGDYDRRTALHVVSFNVKYSESPKSLEALSQNASMTHGEVETCKNLSLSLICEVLVNRQSRAI